MSAPQLAADSLSIVVPGLYQPLLVSPQWILDKELIRETDYAARDIELLIPNQVITFKVGAFRVHCQPDRLEVSTDDESEFDRLRDLAVGILRSLPDAKVSQLGINRSVHFFAADSASWNAIGDALVNNDMWGNVLPLAGMRSVVFWGIRSDKYAGRIQVQVEPSFRFPHAVYVTYNDHYELSTIEAQPSTRDEIQQLPPASVSEPLTEKKKVAVEVLADNWRESMHRFTEVLDRIAQQGKVA